MRPFRVPRRGRFSYTPSVSCALRSQLSSRAAARPASPIAAAFAGSSSTSAMILASASGERTGTQVAAHAVGDEVLGTFALAGDHRRALGHRLGVDEPERLVPAGEGDELGARHERQHARVRHAAEEVHGVGDALLRGLRVEGAAQRAVADDREVDAAAVAAQPPEGRDQVADALALDQVADGEHERLAGQVVVRRLDRRAEAGGAVEHDGELVRRDDAVQQAGDGARVGHDAVGGAEHALGAALHGAAQAEVLVHVGAVHGDDVGHAQVGGQALRERAVRQRLVRVDEVALAGGHRRQRADAAVGEVAEAVEQQALRRLQHARVLGGDAVADRLLGFSPRRRWRSSRQRTRGASRRRRDDVRLHAELAQRQQLLVHEEVALTPGEGYRCEIDEDLHRRASAGARPTVGRAPRRVSLRRAAAPPAASARPRPARARTGSTSARSSPSCSGRRTRSSSRAAPATSPQAR